MTTLAELMTEAATSGFATLRAEDGSETRVNTLTVARLWTLSVDDTIRFGFLGREASAAPVVLEDGGNDVIRVGDSLRYSLLTNIEVSTADAIERLCVKRDCLTEVVSPAVEVCLDHLDMPMYVVALLLRDGDMARPEGCTDDEAAIVQLSRERRLHQWSEDIARRELAAAGEGRVIAHLTAKTV